MMEIRIALYDRNVHGFFDTHFDEVSWHVATHEAVGVGYKFTWHLWRSVWRNRFKTFCCFSPTLMITPIQWLNPLTTACFSTLPGINMYKKRLYVFKRRMENGLRRFSRIDTCSCRAMPPVGTSQWNYQGLEESRLSFGFLIQQQSIKTLHFLKNWCVGMVHFFHLQNID